MSDVMRWEEPPSSMTPKDRWRGITAALRGRPGQWAMFEEELTPSAASNRASRIRKGMGSFAPRGAFEAIISRDGSSAKVYARYVGDPGGAP